jgi:glutaredoxin|tara:strand:+ start:760 stop:1038 length:279 start_codon:yes stop_codon:yes gene_type:complete
MDYDIKLYTTHGCGYCIKMKELFKRAEIDYYEEIVVGQQDDPIRRELLKKYPMAVGFPFVAINDEPIGSLVEVAKWMLEKELISRPSRKKDE